MAYTPCGCLTCRDLSRPLPVHGTPESVASSRARAVHLGHADRDVVRQDAGGRGRSERTLGFPRLGRVRLPDARLHVSSCVRCGVRVSARGGAMYPTTPEFRKHCQNFARVKAALRQIERVHKRSQTGTRDRDFSCATRAYALCGRLGGGKAANDPDRSHRLQRTRADRNLGQCSATDTVDR
jgi:hypothetical protein